jgi:hypothetical protein
MLTRAIAIAERRGRAWEFIRTVLLIRLGGLVGAASAESEELSAASRHSKGFARENSTTRANGRCRKAIMT